MRLLCLALAQAALTLALGPLPTSISHWHPDAAQASLLRRATTSATTADLITCGYLDGNVNAPRSAAPGFDCRVDTAHGIWGFCPTTVIAATDCGLAAACVDAGSCSSTCKINADTALTTFTCTSGGFCSTALLTFGVDQTYAYLGCGDRPATDHYVVTPTFTPSSRTSAPSSPAAEPTPSSKAKPASSPAIKSASTALTSTSISATSTSPTSPTSPTSRTTSTVASAASASAASAASSTHQPEKSSTSTNLGAIIGGVLGGIALVCLTGVAIVFIMRRRGASSSSSSKAPSTMRDPDTTYAASAPPYSAYPPPPPPHPVYEFDSSEHRPAWKMPVSGNPRSPVELSSHMDY